MLVLVLVVAAFVVPVSWGLADLLRRPKDAFVAAGQNRGLWLALLVVALAGPFLVGIPPVVSSGVGVWYVAVVRPKVARAMAPTPPVDEL